MPEPGHVGLHYRCDEPSSPDRRAPTIPPSVPPTPPAAGPDGAEVDEERADGERDSSSERDTRDLVRGAGVNYLGFLARLGSRAPFLFLAGILYGASAFGVFTFATTVVETAAALALFGMKRSLNKVMSDAVADDQGLHRSVSSGIALALVLGTVATLAVAGGAGILAGVFRMPSASYALLLLSLAIPMIVVSDILLVAIRFTRQMRFEVYARSVLEPVTLTVTIVLAWWAGARELGLIIGYVTALTVAAGATAFFFVRLFPVREYLRVPLRWAELRELVTFTGPTAGYEVTLLLAKRVDVFLVSYFTPASVVGVFGMAKQFSTVTKKIRSGFDPILRPVLSDSIAVGEMERARDQLSMVARWVLAAQLPVILAFVFYADDLLGLMGSGFAGGAMILVFLMLGDAVEGCLGVTEIPIVYLRPVANIFLGLAWVVATVGFGIWLAGPMGGEGVALAVALALVVVNAGRLAVAGWALDMNILEVRLLRPLAAALPAGALVWALERFLAPPPLVAVLVGLPLLLVTYFAGLMLVGLEPEGRAQVERLKRRIGLGGSGG